MVTTRHESLISIIALALTSRCSAQLTSAPALQTISIGTGEFVVDPNNVVLDGITVSAGGPAITINNEPVLMDVADDLFVGDKEVLTGRATKINITGSVSSQNAATSSVRAGNSSSSMRTEYSSSTIPQLQADLNIAALQAFAEYLETRSGASGTSQAISLLSSTVQSATTLSSITSPSRAQGNFQASSLLSSTGQLTPSSSSIASSSVSGVHGNAVLSASSSGNSPSASTFSVSQSNIQPQNSTSSSASSTIGIGGLGGQNASTKTWTPSSILGNLTGRGSPSLAVSSLSSLVVNSKSAITTFAPATSFIPTASSQPNTTAASSSVLILAGALLSLSAQGKSLSDEIALPPTKTSFIETIETIESQVTKLKGLLEGLGGNTIAPPSCHASKSKARFKKRDLLGDLDKILSDVECAVQDLSSLTIKLQAELPTPDDISPALDDLGDTASDMEKSDEDDDENDTSTESPSQARSSKESPSQTRTSTRSQTMTSFGSTIPNSISSSSAISSQTTIEYPCYSGSLYMDPASISDDADEVSAFNALLPSLLSSEFGADLSGFVTVAANATSSANATSAVSITSTAAGGKGISAPSTTQITATPNSLEQSWLSSRLAPTTSPPTTQITVTSKVLLQPSLSSRQTAAELTSSGQTPTSSTIANVAANIAANIAAILANPPSHPACSMVLANTGDGCAGVDYCDCSATYVPPLTSTVNGSLTSGCSYATQPPANDCPINSIALEVASAIVNLRLTSSASDDIPTSIPSTGSAPSAPAPGLETPEYSGLDTPTAFAPPEPTTSPSAPFPSIVSHNDKGSTLCSSLNNGAQSCKAAYSYYNPEYLYLDYTAYVQSDDTTAPGSVAVISPTADRGCSAMLRCAVGAVGLYGKQIIAAFDALYSYADVQICGSIYLAGGCWMTTDFCSECEASVPCAALPVEVQPDQGGSWPCYFPNGTVWHG